MDEYIGKTSFCNIFLENNNHISGSTDITEKEIIKEEENKEVEEETDEEEKGKKKI